jgi:hypothetical protein
MQFTDFRYSAFTTATGGSVSAWHIQRSETADWGPLLK